MKQQKTQSGFAHLAIIIVLAVALVGTLGFVFWQNFMQKKDSDTSKANTTTSTSKTTTTTPTTTPTTTNSNPGYIVLNDWGVKFKLPSNLGSDTITYKKTPSATYQDGYSFSTASVEAIGGACGVAGVGWISRYTDTTNLPVNVGIFVTKIGDYSYYSLMAMADCSNGSSNAPADAYPIIRSLLLSVEKE